MHPLDNPEFVLRHDPKGMYRLTADFPRQCEEALAVGRAADLPSLTRTPDQVVLTGLGGSAAGGDFTRALFDAQGSVPFSVNRDYYLPSHVGRESLVIAVSYSGNTEETLAAFDEAVRRGCTVIGVTSGGQLADRCRRAAAPLVTIPGGQPPRTALAYLFWPVVAVCERLGLLPEQPYDTTIQSLQRCVTDWGLSQPIPENPCKQLAEILHGKVSVLYGLGPWQALVANRWKGQINENAKNMTFANAFPELCHNEILGWVKADGQGVQEWVTVILEDGTESPKMRARAKVTTDLISPVSDVETVRARGSSLFERLSTLTTFGDFVSLYLAALNEVDPENINSINVLKAELAKVEG